MVLIIEEVPAEMLLYHEPPNVRPDPPSAMPLLQPYVPAPLPGSQEDYESQFQVFGYNPFGSSDEAGVSFLRTASVDSDDTSSTCCWTPGSSRAPSEQADLQQQNWAQGYAIPAGTTRAGAATQGVKLPNQTLADYQMHLMLLESQNTNRRRTASGQSVQTHDYWGQLRLLDEQNNVRVMAARQSPQRLGSHVLQDYQTQLRLLEQRDGKRLTLSRQDPVTVPGQELTGSRARGDYEMQLELVYDPEKKRRILAERHQHTQKRHALQDCQMDLMMGEQRQKKARVAKEGQQTEDLFQGKPYPIEDRRQHILHQLNTAQHMTVSQQQRPKAPVLSGAAAADYLKQLDLLEQQNYHSRLVAQQQEQQQATTSAASYAEVDIERQCSVIEPHGKACHGYLSCKYHSWTQKRSVPGRSAPFDQLLVAQQEAGAAHEKPFQLRPRRRFL